MSSKTPTLPLNPGRTSTLSALLLLAIGSGFGATTHAAEETLECRLKVQSAMSDDNRSSITLEGAGVLGAERLAGVCLFADGTLADKQFVMINKASEDGATGLMAGFSVYTLESGDRLDTRFTGEWGSDGVVGYYTIIGGGGRFENATGDGQFTSIASPWKQSSHFNVVFNVTTP